jgi:hypothetical protein
MAKDSKKNSSVMVYRISNTLTTPPTHYMSVVSGGDFSYYIYQGSIINSFDKDSDYQTWVESVGKKNLAAIKDDPVLNVFVEAILSTSMYYKVTYIMPSRRTLKDTVKAESEYLDMITPRPRETEKNSSKIEKYSATDRKLSDDLAELVGSNKELERFFETGQAEKEPEAMRDFVRLILEAHDAVDLNPQLADWLAGGPAPEDMEDGLILYPEVPQTMKGK